MLLSSAGGIYQLLLCNEQPQKLWLKTMITIYYHSWFHGLMGSAGQFFCSTWFQLWAAILWRVPGARTSDMGHSLGWQWGLSGAFGSDVSGNLHNLPHVTHLGFLSLAVGFWEGEVQEDWRNSTDFLRPRLKVYGVTYIACWWPKQVTCQPRFKDKGNWIPLSGRSGKEFVAIVDPRQAVVYSMV